MSINSAYKYIIPTLGFMALICSAPATTAEKVDNKGQQLALEQCQACHEFPGSEQAGNAGPPFAAMKKRFPKRDKLYAIIYDAQAAIKPHTMMPPFGRMELLDKAEINLVIDYLYTL